MPKRKHRPVWVERDACLHLLGLLGKQIEWNHVPPLAMREQVLDGDGNHVGYIPDENDPRYLVPMLKEAHRAATTGKPHDASNGDIHKIAKAKRLEKKQKEFRARLLAKGSDAEQPPRRKWPSRPLRGWKEKRATQ